MVDTRDMLSETDIGSYALDDRQHWVAWAMGKDFDGIIHTGVSGATGQNAALPLVGKSAASMAGLDHDSDDDPTNVPHRPFHQRQIESVFNRRGSDPEKDHVGEARDINRTSQETVSFKAIIPACLGLWVALCSQRHA